MSQVTSSQGEPILEDNFVVIQGRNSSHGNCSLYKNSLTITLDGGKCIGRSGNITEILLKDVIGCHCLNSKLSKSLNQLGDVSTSPPSSPLKEGSVSAHINIYWYPKSVINESGDSVYQIQRRPITLKVEGKQETLLKADKWARAINYLRKGLEPANLPAINHYVGPTEKPMLFLINPKSGSGKALSLFNDQVLPILKESGVEFEMVLTTRQNHGRELVAKEDIRRWKAIVIVSGDGLVHEVYNGLFERDDWAQACQIPVGVIPGGSGNGLAKAISFENQEADNNNPVRQASLRAVKCANSPMDIVCVEMPTGTMYSFLSAGWGFISDVDIESERLRWLGETRFSVWSFHRIANLRLYRGRLSYLQAEGFQPANEMQKQKKKGSYLKRSTSVSLAQQTYKDNFKNKRERFFSVSDTNYDSVISGSSEEDSFKDVVEDEGSEINTFHSLTEWNEYVSKQQTKNLKKVHTPDLGLPSLSSPVPANWTTVEDDFVLIYAVHQSHITSSLLCSPWSHLADGLMFLFTIRRGAFPNKKVQKATIAQFLLKMEKGEHIYLPGVEMIPVRAFRIEPLEDRGCMTVDGESVPRGLMQASVLPSMVRILS